MAKETFSLPVFSTEDYTIFQKLNGNRELYSGQIKKLLRVVEKDKEFTKENPIVVNEKLEVIDGQHRIAAYSAYKQKTGETLPIYYTIKKGANIQSARAFNAGSRAWISRDYAQAYASEGNKAYKTYLHFAKKYPDISHNVLHTALTGIQRSSEYGFREGDLVIANEKEADSLLSQLMDMTLYYKEGRLQGFAIAYMKIARNEQYDHERMVKQMQKHHKALYGVPERVGEMLAALNTIYNMGMGGNRIDLSER